MTICLFWLDLIRGIGLWFQNVEGGLTLGG
jgi:hypothetical protein